MTRMCLTGAVLAFAMSARAQGQPVVDEAWRARGIGPFEDIRALVDNKVVKGAPYTAQSITETIQTLADGNRIVRKTTGAVYRDSEGRTRRECILGANGPLNAVGPASAKVFINDPVAGVHYVLTPERKEALKLSPPPPREPLVSEKEKPNRQSEDLGRQIFEGIEAEGRRTRMVLPSGAIGNERSLEIVSERWYAPSLQAVVFRKRNDPRFGETTFRLTNITTSEPPHALFTLPSDYTVTEGLPFPAGKKGAHRE